MVQHSQKSLQARIKATTTTFFWGVGVGVGLGVGVGGGVGVDDLSYSLFIFGQRVFQLTQVATDTKPFLFKP